MSDEPLNLVRVGISAVLEFVHVNVQLDGPLHFEPVDHGVDVEPGVGVRRVQKLDVLVNLDGLLFLDSKEDELEFWQDTIPALFWDESVHEGGGLNLLHHIKRKTVATFFFHPLLNFRVFPF